jgi:threonylcarbamoyladenosine tRNA methylthiotransferase MtaB
MARRCRAEEFSRLAALLRNAVPDINITTDIIVGFPGETDAEWAETLDFAERTGFGNIHIFPFSPRSGTAAAEMGNPVSGAVKKSRVQALHELSARLQRAFLEPRVGRSFSVLWEGARTLASGTQEICGYTPNYLKVVLAGSSVSRLSYGITPITADRIAPSGDCLMGREPAISR